MSEIIQIVRAVFPDWPIPAAWPFHLSPVPRHPHGAAESWIQGFGRENQLAPPSMSVYYASATAKYKVPLIFPQE